MKYGSTELRRALAAEYVLGTLRGRARLRFEHLLAGDADWRAEVRLWEIRFGELAQRVTPVAPPENIWAALERQSRPAPGSNTVPLRRPESTTAPAAKKRAAPSSWRILAGLATAAAVVVTVLMTQPRSPLTEPPPAEVAQNNVPATPPAEAPPVQTPAPAAPAEPPAPPAASYVALLKMPGSDMQWTVSLTPTRGRMTAAASGNTPRLRGHSAELWWLSPGGPVALGVLPLSGDGSMELPAELASATEMKLAISIEPPGGSPSGKPTGPVVVSAVAVRVA